MGQKDITEKILMDYNDIFSDIINVLLFDGDRRVDPDSLESAGALSQYKADDGAIHQQERDVTKNWNGNGIRIATFGIENQSEDERDLVFRVLSYDGASYRSQLLSDRKERIPVATIVLYFGSDHWNAPRTLKELVKIPEGLDKFINDYRINVFEISWLTEEQVSMFQSDFGVVADFFVKKRLDPDYIPADKRVIKHVDEVMKLLAVMTGDDRYEKVLQEEGKEDIQTMCDVAERLEKRGYDNGYEKGRQEERIIIFKELVKKGVYTPEQAEKESGISANDLV